MAIVKPFNCIPVSAPACQAVDHNRGAVVDFDKMDGVLAGCLSSPGDHFGAPWFVNVPEAMHPWAALCNGSKKVLTASALSICRIVQHSFRGAMRNDHVDFLVNVEGVVFSLFELKSPVGVQ